MKQPSNMSKMKRAQILDHLKNLEISILKTKNKINEKQESIKKLDLDQCLNKFAELLDRNPALTNAYQQLKCLNMVLNSQQTSKQELAKEFKTFLTLLGQINYSVGSYAKQEVASLADIQEWAQQYQALLQQREKLKNQQVQRDQLQVTADKDIDRLHFDAKSEGKILAFQRMIRGLVNSQCDTKDYLTLPEHLREGLMTSFVQPANNHEFWTNLVDSINNYLLLSTNKKFQHEFQQIISRLKIDSQYEGFEFPQHRPELFEEYTEIPNLCFKVDDRIYFFDEMGGWCDENGCYYSSDNEPKGWFWVKSNNEVIYFSQDYAPKTFLASDRNLSWLMAQVRRDKEEKNRRERRENQVRQNQRVKEDSSSRSLSPQSREEGKLSAQMEWKAIKEVMEFQTQGISVTQSSQKRKH